MESPPGVTRENDLRPHSPLAREDLKPLGSEWSLTYVICNEWICIILTKSTQHTCLNLGSHALKVKTTLQQSNHASNTNLSEMKHVSLLSGTGRCIPSANHTTVHSDSAMEFMSGFPSNIPQKEYIFHSLKTTSHTN